MGNTTKNSVVCTSEDMSISGGTDVSTSISANIKNINNESYYISSNVNEQFINKVLIPTTEYLELFAMEKKFYIVMTYFTGRHDNSLLKGYINAIPHHHIYFKFKKYALLDSYIVIVLTPMCYGKDNDKKVSNFIELIKKMRIFLGSQDYEEITFHITVGKISSKITESSVITDCITKLNMTSHDDVFTVISDLQVKKTQK
jgi:hypothetical protein